MRQYTRLSIIIVGNFDEGNISNELHDFGFWQRKVGGICKFLQLYSSYVFLQWLKLHAFTYKAIAYRSVSL